MRKIALATCERLPNLTEDDRDLIPAFSRKNLTSEAVVWSNPGVDWNQYDAVIIRSCWDYWTNRDTFLQWTRRLQENSIPLFNPSETIHWNTTKNYLKKFHQMGIPIPATEWICSSASPNLGPSSDLNPSLNPDLNLNQIMKMNSWKEVVIKPIISAGAYLTSRINIAEVELGEEKLKEILEKGEQCGGAMIQPFLPEILSTGEVSLIFFGGVFSHAIRKKAPTGEFRIQPQYGGMNMEFSPSSKLLDFAKTVLAFIPEQLLYSRVDILESSQGPLLMELELTEPNLFLQNSPGAPDRFVRAFQSFL